MSDHPLAKFRYCPVCGSKHWAEHDFKSKQCGNCGFVYYANPCSATAAFITDDEGRLLVVRRAKEPAKGTLDLPGGFIDMDETAEEGMRREISEETGLQVVSCRYLFSIPNLYTYSGMVIHTLDMFFQCRVQPGVAPRAADDAGECLWLRRDDVHPEDFGLHSISLGVKKWLDTPA